MIHPTAKIHPTAIIEDGALIGESTSIGAYSVICKNVIVGKDNNIKSHVVIEGNTQIGNNNFIDCFSLIGSEPQDPKYNNELYYTEIGNYNKFYDRIHITGGIKTTVVGNNNTFMTASGIAHDTKLGNNNVLSYSSGIMGNCILENNIVFGFLSGCHQETKIGSYSMVGANTFIRNDVLPFSMLKGNPAELVGPNVVGMKRNGFSKKEIKIAFDIFNILNDNIGIKKEKYENICKMNNSVSNIIKTFLEK